MWSDNLPDEIITSWARLKADFLSEYNQNQGSIGKQQIQFFHALVSLGQKDRDVGDYLGVLDNIAQCVPADMERPFVYRAVEGLSNKFERTWIESDLADGRAETWTSVRALITSLYCTSLEINPYLAMVASRP